MCVWCVVGYPTSGGVLRVFGCHFGFLAGGGKNNPSPLRICPSARLTTAPDRLDWVHEWVQQSGLMPICPGSQARFRHEVVGLLTPRLYVRGVHALPFDRQLGLGVMLDLGRVTKFSEPRPELCGCRYRHCWRR